MLAYEGAMVCCCCCCSEIGAACKRLIGPRKLTKINYLIVMFGLILPIILLAYLLQTLTIIKWINFTPSIIARTSFVLFLLFLSMFLIALCRNRVAMIINEGLFTVKYMLCAILLIGSLFMGNDFFIAYSNVAKFISFVYIVLQSIILIDLSYIFGGRLAKRYSEGQEQCGGVLIGLTIIIEGIAITLNILGYINYSNDQCGNSLWLNVVVSIILVLIPLVQLLNLNPQNSLLSSSLVSLLIAYLAYSALLSYGQGCTFRITLINYIVNLTVTLKLFILTTYGTIMGGLDQEDEIQRLGSEKQIEELGQRQYSTTNVWTKWHFFMCLASIYLCMVFSNWESVDTSLINMRGSSWAFYVQAIASIVTAAIYIWTMIAPGIIPERNFTIE